MTDINLNRGLEEAEAVALVELLFFAYRDFVAGQGSLGAAFKLPRWNIALVLHRLGRAGHRAAWIHQEERQDTRS